MREQSHVNSSVVNMFDQSLSSYEATLPEYKEDPSLFSGPAQHLQMALSRLLAAAPGDTYQMMRSLAQHMIANPESYTEYNLLTMSSGSPSNTFKQDIMAIVYVLYNVMKGQDPPLDSAWMNRINGNRAILQFLINYGTSDLSLLAKKPASNIVTATLPYEQIMTQDAMKSVELTSYQKIIKFNGSMLQTLLLTPGPGWNIPQDVRKDIPVCYRTTLFIHPSTKEFLFPKTVPLTPAAQDMVDILKCMVMAGNGGNYYHFTVPASFYSMQLDLFSVTAGESWSVGNVRVHSPATSTR